MKTILALSLLAVLSNPARATEAQLIKTCDTVLRLPEQTEVPTLVQVRKDGDTLKAQVIQTNVEGKKTTFEETAEISEHQIRADLNPEIDLNENTLNEGEKLVVHAMILTSNELFKNFFSAGFDLSAARSVKVYDIGKATNMGRSAIVEAKDANGKDLGSFLGGFLVSPCK